MVVPDIFCVTNFRNETPDIPGHQPEDYQCCLLMVDQADQN